MGGASVCVDKIRDTPPSVQVDYLGSASTTPQKIMGRNPHRRALWMAGGATIGLYVHFGPTQPPSGNPGALLIPATPGFLWTFSQLGSAMQQEVWVTSQSATPSYVFSEFIDASEPAPGM